MLSYQPGGTPVHRLDPRSKLLFQMGFGVAVFTHSSATVLGLLSVVAVVALGLCRLSPLAVARAYWLPMLLVAFAPLVATVRFVPPGIEPGRAAASAVAGYRVLLVLALSAAFVVTTPVRATRAAVQRHVPGRLGQLLGVGTGLVFRLFPLLQADLRRTQLAIDARAGGRRSTLDRTRLLVTAGLARILERRETLSVALRARCFAWNPTLPALSFTWLDYPVLALAALLAVTPFL